MTGMRCARAAPSSRPMQNAPAMPITVTSSVRFSPSASSSRLSQMICQLKLATNVVTSSWLSATNSDAQGRPRGPPLRRDRLGVAIGRGILADRVLEAPLRAGNVGHEAAPVLLRRVRLDDLLELAPLRHVAERRVDPVGR